ncbi:MAG TPA: 50S ribosomal protein L21 [Pirellulales bacterium]|jgi:large subunit ribosomal protein L21|nr:50S ribosomal protein L21 [Pirellulales bacterium]
MYAIISDGGRQYKVEEGQTLHLDYRSLSAGAEVKFDKVLAYSDGSKTTLGSPLVGGATVTGEVVGLAQGPKLVVQRFRRRKNSRRHNGHRQLHTTVKISKISVG